MGWSYGILDGREVGYGVPASCDADGCHRSIDRGLAHRCGDLGDPVYDSDGEVAGSCGAYCCEYHLDAETCAVCRPGDDWSDVPKSGPLTYNVYEPHADPMFWIRELSEADDVHAVQLLPVLRMLESQIYKATDRVEQCDPEGWVDTPVEKIEQFQRHTQVLLSRLPDAHDKVRRTIDRIDDIDDETRVHLDHAMVILDQKIRNGIAAFVETGDKNVDS